MFSLMLWNQYINLYQNMLVTTVTVSGFLKEINLEHYESIGEHVACTNFYPKKLNILYSL